MDVGTVSFGEEHFGACVLGDRRLTRRAVLTANRMLAHPGGTLPDKLNNNADLMGFYRLANNDKITHGKLLAAHVARTRFRIAAASGVVLILHDTTELDFSGLHSVEDMGPIGDGGGRGFLCHNSLAYGYENREVLGLASQILHKRRKVPDRETRKASRHHPERESRLWKAGWKALGPVPAGPLRVNIADRGADLQEFTEAMEQAQDHYVVRSKANRRMVLDGPASGISKVKLHDFARALPTLCLRQVQVQANHGQSAREAVVRVAAGPVLLAAPQVARGEHSTSPQAAWVVYAREIDPPAAASPLEWILLTNVPVANPEQAHERISWYACRPVVEEFHKAQKTGCGIELPQFTTGEALQAGIAMLSVVATQLLRLRDVSRLPDANTRPASDLVEPEYVEVLSAWRFGEIHTTMSVYDFCWALAKLGGHLNRKHDRPPGWLVLWRGWTKLELMVQGAQASRVKRCV